MKTLLCVLLLLIVAPMRAQSKPTKPTMSAAAVRASAAAVFYSLVWRSEKSSSPHLFKGSEKLFVSVFDFKDQNITSAASVKYLRDAGYNAFAGWRSKKVAPNGGFEALYIRQPEVKMYNVIRWQIFNWNVVEKGSEFENSLAGYWITMRKERRGWKAVAWEHGIAAG